MYATRQGSLGVSNVFPTTAFVQTVVTYHHEAARLVGKVIRFQHRGPTDELHPFTRPTLTRLPCVSKSWHASGVAHT